MGQVPPLRQIEAKLFIDETRFGFRVGVEFTGRAALTSALRVGRQRKPRHSKSATVVKKIWKWLQSLRMNRMIRSLLLRRRCLQDSGCQ